MKKRFLFLSLVLLASPVMAENPEYLNCVSDRQILYHEADRNGAPKIPIECEKLLEKEKIQWLGKLSYTEEYNPLEPVKWNMTFKDNIEIGLREDGIIVWRKKK